MNTYKNNTYILCSIAAKLSMCLCLAFIVSNLTACVPTGEHRVNTELFKDKEDLKTRTGELAPGMTKVEVFRQLNISMDRFERMNLEDVQKAIYGNSMVTGTPAQLEEFRRRLQAYEGFSLPYKNIDSDSSIGLGKMKTHKQGADLQLILVFEYGRLLRTSIEGSEKLNVKENQYLWGTLINRGIGIAF